MQPLSYDNIALPQNYPTYIHRYLQKKKKINYSKNNLYYLSFPTAQRLTWIS
jgi:hypothetical protein